MLRTGTVFFTNCTDPSNLCTRPEPIYNSASGTCDVITGRCQCPPGNDGADLYVTWNDCHINQNSVFITDAVAMVIVALCCLCSLLGIFRLLIHWGIIYWVNGFETGKGDEPDQSPRLVANPDVPLADAPKRRPTLIGLLPSVDLGELQTPPTNARTNMFQQMVTERKRRRNTLTMIIVFFFFSASSVIFQGYRLNGYAIEDRSVLMILCMAFMITTVIIALWMMTYTWFSNMPSLRMFVNMFPDVYGAAVVKYPRLLKNFMVINCLAVAACAYGLLIPVIVDQAYVSAELYSTAMSLIGWFVLVFAITHTFVCMVLLQLFWAYNAKAAMRSPGPGVNTKPLGNGERTVNIMVGLTSIAGPVFCAWCQFMAFHPVGIRYSFLFLDALLVGASFSGIIATYIFVFRMGSKQRIRKDSSSQSPLSTSPNRKSKNRGSIEHKISKELSPLLE